MRAYRTVTHLRARQLWCRLLPARGTLLNGPAPVVRPTSGPWQQSIPRPLAEVGRNRFRFLNQEREVAGWSDAGIPTLWLYNMHYHDSPNAALIQRWISENMGCAGVGWRPYPLSLRIVNWIKWALNGNRLPAGAARSLAEQAGYLSGVLEYDILANHLFVNAKALVFAGTFFQAPVWLEKGLAILASEIREQVLPDGAHFERSPMYHSLCLEDLLDLCNLSAAYAGMLPDLREPAQRMLGWLKQVLHPDGWIAFFNDSTFGVAPEPAAIFDYGRRLGMAVPHGHSRESGYIRLENEHTVVLFDAAPIGPDYQPAHAHADTLSFELSHRGRRLLVNSGTSTYEAGTQRQWERGTAAHNTIRIDRRDSSEVWSAFRVGRRAHPAEVATDSRSYAEAVHDGYSHLRQPVRHRRRLELSARWLTVTDSIEGRGDHEVEVFFHLHPDANVDITLDSRFARSVEPTTYHPGFNLSVPKQTVVGRYRGPCPVTFVSHVPFK